MRTGARAGAWPVTDLPDLVHVASGQELSASHAPERGPLGGINPGQVSILGWVTSGLIVVQALLFLPHETLVPEKAAVLLPLGALGLPFLVAMAAGRLGRSASLVWAARSAMAFLAWAALSAALSSTPESAFFGLYAQMTGWIFLLCVAGAWAVATRLTPTDRSILELAIIVAATGNGIIAVIEQHDNLSSIGLPLYPGYLQPIGTLGNPVFLGALLAGALALVAPRFVRSPLWWSPVVIVLGLGLGVCGERLPLILVVVLLVGEVLSAGISAHRSGRRGSADMTRSLWPILLFSALAVGMLVIGSVTAGSNSATPATTSVSPGSASPSSPATGATTQHGGVISHIQSSTSYETFGQRFDIWAVAVHAFADRPIVGYGPNQFRSATLSRYTPSLISAMESDIYNNEEYLDGHDFVVELAVTVGVVGLGLFLIWLYFCLRRGTGPLLVFALVLLASELAEPLNPVITTLAFVALGAAAMSKREQDRLVSDAGGTGAVPPSSIRPVTIASWALGVLALIPAVCLVVGDVAYAEASVAPPLTVTATSNANTAETFLSPWPQPAALWASIYATPELNSIGKAAQWQRAAVARDRTNALLLEELAVMEVSAGNEEAGRNAAVAAVAAQPWNASALDLLGAIDQNEGKRAAARTLYEKSLSILPGQQLVEAFLAGQCRPALPGSNPDQPLSLGCAAGH